MLDGIELESYHKSMYYVYFIVRRLLIGFFLIYFHAYPYFQLTGLMLFSWYNFLYQWVQKPMAGYIENKTELFNEFCIYLCAQTMNVFLADAAPPEFMSLIGWVFMGISGVNIAVNLILI